MPSSTGEKHGLNGNAKWFAAIASAVLLSFGGGRFSVTTPRRDLPERVASLEKGQSLILDSLSEMKRQLGTLLNRKER